MAFDIRCPECKAKLRLDEAPDPDTPIECPRCGSQFAAPDPDEPPAKPARSPRAAKGAKGAGKKARRKDNMPRKRRAKKQKTNVVVLFGAIIGGFVGLIAVGALMIWFLNRATKVEEMLSYVPDGCNWARGVNVSQLSKYPGYKAEVDKYMTAPVKAAVDELAQAAGHDKDTFVDYLIIAKNKGSGGGITTMYVFRSQKSFDPQALGKSLSGASAQGDGTYRMPGSAGGVLSGATVYIPTNRLVVVAQPGLTPARGGKDGTFAGQLDTTARVVIRGSIWLVIRATGGMKPYIAATTALVNKDFKELDDQGKTATTFGVWTTPGGTGVRVGAAIQCGSPKDAAALVKSFREGPLGKEDESEPPHQFRQVFNVAGDKKAFSEFMQYLRFKSQRECAYIVSEVSGDNAKRFMDLFNNPAMGTGDVNASTIGPPGGFPGGGPPGMSPGPNR